MMDFWRRGIQIRVRQAINYVQHLLEVDVVHKMVIRAEQAVVYLLPQVRPVRVVFQAMLPVVLQMEVCSLLSLLEKLNC